MLHDLKLLNYHIFVVQRVLWTSQYVCKTLVLRYSYSNVIIIIIINIIKCLILSASLHIVAFPLQRKFLLHFALNYLSNELFFFKDVGLPSAFPLSTSYTRQLPLKASLLQRLFLRHFHLIHCLCSLFFLERHIL